MRLECPTAQVVARKALPRADGFCKHLFMEVWGEAFLLNLSKLLGIMHLLAITLPVLILYNYHLASLNSNGLRRRSVPVSLFFFFIYFSSRFFFPLRRKERRENKNSVFCVVMALPRRSSVKTRSLPSPVLPYPVVNSLPEVQQARCPRPTWVRSPALACPAGCPQFGPRVPVPGPKPSSFPCPRLWSYNLCLPLPLSPVLNPLPSPSPSLGPTSRLLWVCFLSRRGMLKRACCSVQHGSCILTSPPINACFIYIISGLYK